MAVMTATLACVFEPKEENNARIRRKRAARRSVLFFDSLNTGSSPCCRRPLPNNPWLAWTAAAPLVKALTGSLTMAGRRDPEAPP
jgi:hypothetical protein